MRLPIPSRPDLRGGALLTTIVVAGILGLALAAYLSLLSNQNQLVVRSQVWNAALPVAEAGAEEAFTHCYNDFGNLAVNGWTLSGGQYVKTNAVSDGGSTGAATLRRNNGYYGVSISGASPFVIRSTGYYPMPGQNFFVSRTIQITASNQGVFSAAIVVKDSIDMNGNNVLTDSYDSTDATKSTLGKYDPAKAGDKGDIATITGLTNSLKVGNANVWGHALTGPTGGVYTGPNGGVGSTNWQRSGNIGIEPGWWSNDLNFSIPDVAAPFVAATPPSGGTVGGVSYAAVLGSGNYMMSKLNGNTIVTGNAVLYTTSGIQFSSGETITIMAGASLKLYNGGSDATFSTIINSNGPVAFQYFGLNSNDGTVTLNGTTDFTGCIDAPYAKIMITGGGTLAGSIVARTVKMNGSASVHYDESLRNVPPNRSFVITSWTEL